MNKYLKTLTISFCCLAPVGLVIGFTIPWTKITNLSCVGSSGVKSFVEIFGDEYKKKNSLVDVSIETGGSGFGIRQIANGYAAIGNASKNPFGSVDHEFKELWTNQNIKTVTIAWEAICIIYSLPEKLSKEAKENIEVSIDENNIKHLYAVFSGFNELRDEQWQESWGSLWNFMSEESQAKIKLLPADEQICKDASIIPYARGGGNITSGTAAAFFDESGLTKKPIDELLTERQITAFQSGQYGQDRKIFETDEANSRAWDIFSKNTKAAKDKCSMVYLSSGFVEQNMKLIEKNGFKVSQYKKNPYNIKSITDGYDWYRPINCMFPTSIIDSQNPNNWTPTMQFMSWLLFGDNIAKPVNDDLEHTLNFDQKHVNKLNEAGARFLTSTQVKSMCANRDSLTSDNFWLNFWTSDYNLEKTRLNQVFGADKK